MFKGIFVILLVVSSLYAEAPTPPKKATVCLNMIVKNESPVIQRCLNSVKEIIDYWVILDTGSSDGTQTIIQETLRDIPGELHERPWVNFGHNRNEALNLAKGKSDYVFFIDADEQLVLSSNFSLPAFDKDYYYITFQDKQLLFSNIAFVNMQKDWEWIGAVHETLDSQTAKTSELIPEITCQRDTSNSARSQDPFKYQKDAQTLEDALKLDPNNSRNIFYLAQSYANCNEYALALKNYEKRAQMEGCPDEKFWALFMIAQYQDLLQLPSETVIQSYSKAYQYYPTRAEPLLHLAIHLTKNHQTVLAYTTAKAAADLPLLPMKGYFQAYVYDYAAKFLLASLAYDLKCYRQASALLEDLLKKNLPEAIQKLTEDLLKSLKKQESF